MSFAFNNGGRVVPKAVYTPLTVSTEACITVSVSTVITVVEVVVINCRYVVSYKKLLLN